MFKLISLFNDSDKLEGSKNYKVWSWHIQSTLIYHMNYGKEFVMHNVQNLLMLLN